MNPSKNSGCWVLFHFEFLFLYCPLGPGFRARASIKLAIPSILCRVESIPAAIAGGIFSDLGIRRRGGKCSASVEKANVVRKLILT